MAIVLFMFVGDLWRKPPIEMTKLAKLLCKAFSYGANPDLFLDPRSSKVDQMKGVDVFKKQMPGSNDVVYACGRYLKKIH